MDKIQEIAYQTDSATQIYETLFGNGGEPVNRYLLADEVGLGKTITAAKVIEKLVEKKQGKTVRIGYICANLALAAHNQKKLTKTIKENKKDINIQEKSADRLSMAFKTILKKSDNNAGVIIDAITPVTSLKVLSSGTLQERCCAYAFLFGKTAETKYMKRACQGKSKTKKLDATIQKERDSLYDSEEAVENFDKFKESFDKLYDEVYQSEKGRIMEASIGKMLNTFEITTKGKEQEHKLRQEQKILMTLLVLAETGVEVGRSATNIKKNNDRLSEVYKELNAIEKYSRQKGVFEKWLAEESEKYRKQEEHLLEKARQIVQELSKKKGGITLFREAQKQIGDVIDEEDKLYYLICFLEQCKSDISDLEEDLLESCIKVCKKKLEALSQCGFDNEKQKKYVSEVQKYEKIKEDIEAVFSDTACTEVLKLARKAMAVAGLRVHKVDLFIADEIQNYSELLTRAMDKEARTETELVIKEVLFNNSNKVLMLSATPFRYRTKLCELENKNKDEECDYNQDNNGEKGAEEDNLTKEELYLQKDTDIYAEFQKIVGYLKKDFQFAEWQRLCREKYDAVQQAYSGASAGEAGNMAETVKGIVEQQNEMLQETHISRMERYMSGISNAFEEDETIVEWSDIGIADLLCVPEMGISIINRADFLEKCKNSEKRKGTPLVLFYRGHLYFSPNSEADKGFYLPDVGLTEDLESLSVWCDGEPMELEDGAPGAVYEITPGYEISSESEIAPGEEKKSSDTGEKDKEEAVWEIECICLEWSQSTGALHKLETQLEKYTTRMDYLKSVPAFLSYRQGYKERYSVSDRAGRCMLKVADIEAFRELELGNARLKKLFKQVFEVEEGHKLLFIPPIMSDRELGGVFENKKGFSKRLFFTDYNMAPKSLATLLTYEANRRVCEDLRKRLAEDGEVPRGESLSKKFPVVKSEASVISTEYFLKVEELLKYQKGHNSDSNAKNEGRYIEKGDTKATQKELINALVAYDKQLYESLFDKEKGAQKVSEAGITMKLYQNASPYYYAAKYLEENNSEKFCKAYYELMTGEDALRVLLAYSEGESLFEAILRYGYDGNIYGVFEEYRELEGEAAFLKSFMEISETKFNAIMVIMKEEAGKEKYSYMKTGYAIGHYAGDSLSNVTKAKTLERKIKTFNAPFRPFHFISTSIGQEGFDFHKYCRIIVHWSLVFDPVKFEQREGRIDRSRSYANRLNVYELQKGDVSIALSRESCEATEAEEREGTVVQPQGKWNTAYDRLKGANPELVKNSRGLYPEFVVPCETYKMKRESYYYRDSYEARMLPEILQGVGYYRSLLGQSGEDTFEEAMKKFLEDKKDKTQYFLDLSPKRNEKK